MTTEEEAHAMEEEAYAIETQYKATFILCCLYQLDVPEVVSILKANSSEKASNILPIRRKPKHRNSRMFSLCLSPLHSYFDDKWQLVEWIEMNMILGVEKIFVYVQDCSNDVLHILKIYESKGAVDIMNWSLPQDLSNKRKKLLHYYGQLAAINDCLYRNMGFSLYIAAFDVDEYIIPQLDKDFTWFEMLVGLPKENAYIFSNSFFIRNESGNTFSKRSITKKNFVREQFIYPPRVRSKFIIKTDEIYMADIHFVRQMNGNQHAVDPKIGLLHHYRRLVPKHAEEPLFTKIKVNISATKKYSHILEQRMTWFLDYDK